MSEPAGTAGLKINDKVICLDDSCQRADLADTPDGLLVRGRVYSVSGVSSCGGVLLAGLRAISWRSGREVGFAPSRFCTLHQFRLRSLLSTADSEDLDLVIDLDLRRRPIGLPQIPGLEGPKPLLDRAIDVLETFHDEFYEHNRTPAWLNFGHWQDQSPEHVRTELRSLLHSPLLPAITSQSKTMWNDLARRSRNHPTILFCRTRSPVANVLFHLCTWANSFSEPLLHGDIPELRIAALTRAAWQIHVSPLRICDAREPGVFLEVLSAAHATFHYAVCDWTLSGPEMVSAYKMTRDSQIAFLCP